MNIREPGLEQHTTEHNNNTTPSIEELDFEYVDVLQPDGEMTRFKRVWGGYRFTDDDVDALMQGEPVTINTDKMSGIRGDLDWLEYDGHEYYGFSPWAAEAYTMNTAPMPNQWNGHTFTADEQAGLRQGESVLVIAVSNRTGAEYAIRVTFGYIKGTEANTGSRWGIIPHFDDFDTPADNMTLDTCVFMPRFGGQRLEHKDIQRLRQGESIKFTGVSKAGRDYHCKLKLNLDTSRSRAIWRIEPNFNNKRNRK